MASSNLNNGRPSQTTRVCHDVGRSKTIGIDGVIFELSPSAGIARAWTTVLQYWVDQGVSANVVVFDRAERVPKIEGVTYVSTPPHNYRNLAEDRRILQRLCERHDVDIFTSTYYSTPLTTPSLLVVYDMIPEVTGMDLNLPMWQEKHHAIRYASGYLCISNTTQHDLLRFAPDIRPQSVTVEYLGVSERFRPWPDHQRQSFRRSLQLDKPYFLYVGTRNGYKNATLLLDAFDHLEDKTQRMVLFVGAQRPESELTVRARGNDVRFTVSGDDALVGLYNCADCVVITSKYEGFGLQMAEAMACSCPVVSSKGGSLAEIGADAVLYHDSTCAGLAHALARIGDPELRQSLTELGQERVRRFQWKRFAMQLYNQLQTVSGSCSLA